MYPGWPKRYEERCTAIQTYQWPYGWMHTLNRLTDMPNNPPYLPNKAKCMHLCLHPMKVITLTSYSQRAGKILENLQIILRMNQH